MEDISPWITNGLIFMFSTLWVAVLAFLGKMLYDRIGKKVIECPAHKDCMRRIEETEKETRNLRMHSADVEDFKSLRSEWGTKFDNIMKSISSVENEVVKLKVAFARIHPNVNPEDKS